MNTIAPPPATDNRDPQTIGQQLLDAGLITEDQLRIGLLEQTRSKQQLGRTLIKLGFLTEGTLRDILSARLGQPSIELSSVVVDPATLALVPEQIARQHRLLPLHFDSKLKRLTLASPGDHDIIALDALRSVCDPGIDFTLRLAAESELRQALDRHYGYQLSIDGILHEIESGTAPQPHDPGPGHPRQPVIRLVDALLVDAVKHEASDIHFEPEAGFLRIRYRVDGLLQQIRVLHNSYWPAMVVRLKVMAGLNIAETRSPQDGRISLTLSGRPIDFRVSAQPTLHGENIVLRILDRQKGIVPLAHLGLAPEQLERITQMIAHPEGLILVTGPTGSGKTTTLYSILNQLNDETRNIMTLEDPVEYPMPMVRQTTISDSARIDFASGVRAMLRQDPDVILVGEIRDTDTAEMALRAAMTGHQVYSTLHTNSALGAIPRLLDIGLRPDLLAGNLVGVIAQRLLRRLCPACRQPDHPSVAEQRLLGILPEHAATTMIHRPRGCPECAHRGYRGRLAIVECLLMDAELDDLVSSQAGARALAAAAARKGFVDLARDGARRVLDGSTSIEELSRVIPLHHHDRRPS
ncbi:MAG: GspE/PulE family protein [Azoarcus sp.]|nr:GspE/PulE family protein [Azoarcus sp.]